MENQINETKHRVSLSINTNVITLNKKLELVNKLQSMGLLTNDGYLEYQDSDKELISEILTSYKVNISL